MALKVTCGCGVSYRVPEEKAGRKLRCGKCDGLFVVPSPAPEESAPPPVDDWEAALAETGRSSGGRSETRTRLPPRVVKKKKKSARVDSFADESQRRTAEVTPASEFQAPLAVALCSLGITFATSMFLKPDGISIGLWLAIRMALIVASLVITFGALFLASMVVEAEYGHVSNGLLKVAAIVLTQDWIGDAASTIPVPFVGGIIAWLATYTMFKYFFGLDDMEAIASMVVVRLVHWVVVTILVVVMIGVFLSGGAVSFPGLPGAGDNGAVVEPDEDAEAEADVEEMQGEP